MKRFKKFKKRFKKRFKKMSKKRRGYLVSRGGIRL